jgi:hypothetical protein
MAVLLEWRTAGTPLFCSTMVGMSASIHIRGGRLTLVNAGDEEHLIVLTAEGSLVKMAGWETASILVKGNPHGTSIEVSRHDGRVSVAGYDSWRWPEPMIPQP